MKKALTFSVCVILVGATCFFIGKITSNQSMRYSLHSATVEEESRTESGITVSERKKLFKLDNHTGRVWEFDTMMGHKFWTEVADSLNLKSLGLLTNTPPN